MNKKRVQITFNVDQTLHQRVKIQAALEDVSMNLWIIKLIYKALRKERE